MKFMKKKNMWFRLSDYNAKTKSIFNCNVFSFFLFLSLFCIYILVHCQVARKALEQTTRSVIQAVTVIAVWAHHQSDWQIQRWLIPLLKVLEVEMLCQIYQWLVNIYRLECHSISSLSIPMRIFRCCNKESRRMWWVHSPKRTNNQNTLKKIHTFQFQTQKLSRIFHTHTHQNFIFNHSSFNNTLYLFTHQNVHCILVHTVIHFGDIFNLSEIIYYLHISTRSKWKPIWPNNWLET